MTRSRLKFSALVQRVHAARARAVVGHDDRGHPFRDRRFQALLQTGAAEQVLAQRVLWREPVPLRRISTELLCRTKVIQAEAGVSLPDANRFPRGR